MEMALFIVIWLIALAFAAIPSLGIWLHAHIIVQRAELDSYLGPNSFIKKLLAPLE